MTSINEHLAIIDKTPEEKLKRRYNYSSKQKLKMKANRAAIEAKRKAENADKLSKKAYKLKRRAKEKLKKANNLSNNTSVITGEYLTPSTEKIVKQKVDVAFRPNKGQQEKFLAAPEKEVLYGGAAGGGKSYAMLVDCLRYVDNANCKALLVRKSMPELQELIDKSQFLYKMAYPGAKWNDKKSRWIFPSGAIVMMSFVENDIDVHRYQGQQFTWIGIDELTHYATPYVWNYLRSRLRTTDLSIETYMRATTNPGGIGGWWVKKMFIDIAPYEEPFWATDIDTGLVLRWPDADYVKEELRNTPLFKRRFIPARLTDNPYLMQSDEYMGMLSSLPEVQRKRLLEGDWDIAEDTAFPEFDKKIHIVEPFDIPDNWLRFRSGDYGYVQPAAILWYAVSHDGTIYVYRELYVKGFDAEALSDAIIEAEYNDPGILTGPLDHDAWGQRGSVGPSPAETMIKNGVKWRRADKGPGSRVRGKVELHRRLKYDAYTKKPGIIFLSNVKNLIRTLPILPLDTKNSEDVDTDFVEDHLYDSLRYGITSRPTHSLYPDEHRFVYAAEQPEIVDPKFGY